MKNIVESMFYNNNCYVYETLPKRTDILLLRQNIQLVISMHYVILGIACGGGEKVAGSEASL